MNQPSFSPAQVQALLQYASARLGLPPEQLKQTVASGGYEGLTAALSPENRQKLNGLLGDPAKAEALLNSEQLRRLLSKI